jgi:uncharacterized protein with PIN domain
MSTAYFRFYEELNDFLPKEKRKTEFPYSFRGRPSVKHAIEALGVPHTEVDLILVNGIAADFSSPLSQGDRVSVYPVFESLDITGVGNLRKKPLRNPKFVLDVHLGKLARLLRMNGFDAHYSTGLDDREIIALAEAEKRIILTRDRDLLKNKQVTRGCWIRSQHPDEQLQEVLRRFDLSGLAKPFTRCLICNCPVEPVAKEAIIDRLEPLTRTHYNEFHMCPQCGRIYWKGGHFERMKKGTMGSEKLKTKN